MILVPPLVWWAGLRGLVILVPPLVWLLARYYRRIRALRDAGVGSPSGAQQANEDGPLPAPIATSTPPASPFPPGTSDGGGTASAPRRSLGEDYDAR